ncbi:MAG: hypothetical protein ABI672_00175 [Vicinamibacteria bacterium]
MSKGAPLNPTRRHLAVVLFACLTAGRTTSAQDSVSKQYTIPNHGRLTLSVPAGMVDASRPITGQAGVELHVGPKAGKDFDLQVTAVWLDADKVARGRVSLREAMKQSAAGPLAQSVETEAKILELGGSPSPGYFYSLTDKAPPPGEFKYLTQGALVTGEIMATFTLLQQRPDEGQKTAILRMLGAAKYSNAAFASEEGVQFRSRDGVLEITHPSSRLSMTIPDPDHGFRKTSSGGDGPRYFRFEDTSTATIVSGWFEPAPGFSNIQKFWKDETAEAKRNGLPAAVNVEFMDAGAWKIVAYDLPLPLGVASHLRAHWVEAGTWIDIHLSNSGMPAAQGRTALRARLSGFKVAPKEPASALSSR